MERARYVCKQWYEDMVAYEEQALKLVGGTFDFLPDLGRLGIFSIEERSEEVFLRENTPGSAPKQVKKCMRSLIQIHPQGAENEQFEVLHLPALESPISWSGEEFPYTLKT